MSEPSNTVRQTLSDFIMCSALRLNAPTKHFSTQMHWAAVPGSSSQDSFDNTSVKDAGEFLFESIVHHKKMFMA